MRRLNLAAARVLEGYNTQAAFAEALRKDNIDISNDEYSSIESGRRKEVGLGIALAIAKKLDRESEIDSLFLPLPTYKIRRESDQLQKTG